MSTETQTRDVSTRDAAELVRRFERFLNSSDAILVERYGHETAAVMRDDILDEYRRLIPGVPYIGGRRNVNACP